MEVQLLRAPSGEVIFLESNAEFVDALVWLLQAPLGSVLQSCSGDGVSKKVTHPFFHLTASIPRIRDAVFTAKKKDVIPQALDLAKVLSGQTHSKVDAKPPATHADCLYCLKVNAAKRPKQKHVQCPHCCVVVTTFQQVVQWAYCAKCVSQGQGSYYMVNNQVCTQCGVSNARTCNSCQWCDACSLTLSGFELPGMPPPQAAKACPTGSFKDTAKFMVTNSLEVFEASPVKMIELVSQVVDGFKGLKTCTAQVTPDHLKEIALRGLLGSEKVLTDTFGNCEVQCEHELGSNAGTDGSFDDW
eukprot:CAMPEP_0172841664 /NCGR_PEP_ID=MMETSP1075-20121228/30145_1 /TAXON_ID=2916 /ORGANISM="Ceratium fusus, Strain PA161109" /LENGTH=300 /DNA_ID=CAMNT_0013685669 /DNA_START=40 /DNA_END=939 /DNA_ORIENTATION=+